MSTDPTANAESNEAIDGEETPEVTTIVYEADDPNNPERTKSPRRAMCAAILSLEAITLGLTTPVMISVHDVSAWVAALIGLGLLVLCLIAAGMLRKPSGYHLGWAIQVASIALGFVVPIMFALGLIFGILWAAGYFLGIKIERERKAAWDALDAANAAAAEAAR